MSPPRSRAICLLSTAKVLQEAEDVCPLEDAFLHPPLQLATKCDATDGQKVIVGQVLNRFVVALPCALAGFLGGPAAGPQNTSDLLQRMAHFKFTLHDACYPLPNAEAVTKAARACDLTQKPEQPRPPISSQPWRRPNRRQLSRALATSCPALISNWLTASLCRPRLWQLLPRSSLLGAVPRPVADALLFAFWSCRLGYQRDCLDLV